VEYHSYIYLNTKPPRPHPSIGEVLSPSLGGDNGGSDNFAVDTRKKCTGGFAQSHLALVDQQSSWGMDVRGYRGLSLLSVKDSLRVRLIVFNDVSHHVD